MKNLFPRYIGIPILVPANIQEFPWIFSVTEIHGEFSPHILQDTNTVTTDSVVYMGNFMVTILLAKLPSPLVEDFSSCNKPMETTAWWTW